MSDLAPRPAAPALTPALLKEAIENPLCLLPADWRPAVWTQWAKWSDLLRTQLSLATTLREWVVEDGLTLAEAKEAFAELNRPARRGAIQYPGQVLAELAGEVGRLLALRRDRERAADRQRTRVREAESAAADFPAVLAAAERRRKEREEAERAENELPRPIDPTP